MPKRKIKEQKPAKRLGKKELLIAPAAMGGSTLLALVIIPLLSPPPTPWTVCLKAHNVETFQLYPTVQVFVDGQEKLLPDGVGKDTKNGQECIHPIHTDKMGNQLHIEYVRPVRLSIADLMKVYPADNSTLITVYDNSTGTPEKQVLDLNNYTIDYSYYSKDQPGDDKFVHVSKLSDFPPFTNEMLAKIELKSKQ